MPAILIFHLQQQQQQQQQSKTTSTKTKNPVKNMALRSGMHVVLLHNAGRKKLSCPRSSSSIVLKRGTQEEH